MIFEEGPEVGPGGGVPLVAVTRGGRVESLHRGSVAVVSEDGRLLASAGDPLVRIYLRSSAKPFQLNPFLAGGGEERFGLTTAEIAVAAASHGGEPVHVRTVAGMLARGGLRPGDLRCGAHPPMHAPSARKLVRRGEGPGVLHNNCSGKHAAMLLACRQRGEETRSYLSPDHPHQRRILSYLSRAAGLPPDRIAISVDGCSAPVFHLPLFNLAVAYARLLGGGFVGEEPREERARRRIGTAMAEAPGMVAGSGRFTTTVMRLFRGELVAKEGAEAVYCMALAPGLLGDQAVGVALKIDDGGERGRDRVSVKVLEQLGAASGERLAALRRLAPAAVRNVRGLCVGELRTVFQLRGLVVEPPAVGRRARAGRRR